MDGVGTECEKCGRRWSLAAGWCFSLEQVHHGATTCSSSSLEQLQQGATTCSSSSAAGWKEADGGGGQEAVYEPISLDHTATILWVHALIPLIPPLRVCVCVCLLSMFIYLSVCLTCNRAGFWHQSDSLVYMGVKTPSTCVSVKTTQLNTLENTAATSINSYCSLEKEQNKTLSSSKM